MSERYLNREARCQVSPGIPGQVQTGLLKCTSRVCSAAVLQTVAGVQGDDVVSYQTRRHIIYITGADTTPGGHT